MMRSAAVATSRERGELIEIVLAATQAVVPHMTDAERTLLGEVIDGMLRDRTSPVNCD
jgi:hypothetical protein